VCAGEDRKHSLLSHSLGFSFTWDSVDLFSFILEIASGTNILCSDIAKIPTPRCVVPVAASAGGMGGIFCKNAQTAPPRHGRDIRARVRGARTTMTTGIKDHRCSLRPSRPPRRRASLKCQISLPRASSSMARRDEREPLGITSANHAHEPRLSYLRG
jgi:hypothetical protein